MQPKEKERLLKYLDDALLAANELETYGVLSPSKFAFNNVKWIAERGIEIISEALKRAQVIQPNIEITNLYKIFATRNKIAHEYDLVDPYQLYLIVKNHIPVLIAEIKILVEQLEADL